MWGLLKRVTKAPEPPPPPGPVVVEEYKIEVHDTEGFKKVHIRFQDAAGRFHLFEMHPAYAHHFSDDVLRHAARALAPKS